MSEQARIDLDLLINVCIGIVNKNAKLLKVTNWHFKILTKLLFNKFVKKLNKTYVCTIHIIYKNQSPFITVMKKKNLKSL